MLSEYIDQRLSDEDRLSVERHVEACSTCADEIASLRYTVGLLKRVPMRAPSRIFTIAEAPEMAPTSRRLMAPAWAYGAVASLAAIVFAVVVSADLSGSLAGKATQIPDAIERETIAEVPVEAAKEVQVEAMRAVEKEMVVEKEVIKEVPGEMAKEVQKEAIREVAKAVVIEKEVIKEAPVQLESEVAAAPPAAERAASAAPMPTPAPQMAAVEDAEVPVAAMAVEDSEPEIAAAESKIAEETLSVPPEAAAPLETGLEQVEAVAPVTTAEALAAEPVETVQGSTSTLWHVLEGALGGVALLLSGVLFHRMWRRRTHIAS